METEPHVSKVEAIYELREAVETKDQAEYELAATGTADARDALLNAQIELEARTQDAIEMCHDCGHSHSIAQGHEPRSRISGRRDNVIAVDFRRDRGEIA